MVFAVMPWNLPFWQVLRFAIPTVLAGNTVLVKHADSVQGCAWALEQLIRDAGAPDGVYLNLAIRRGAVASVVRRAGQRHRFVPLFLSQAAAFLRSAISRLSISASRKASSRLWLAFRRGSQWVW